MALTSKGRKKINGERVMVFETRDGFEVVEQVDARNGGPILVTLTGARAMRSATAHYPLGSQAEQILAERFCNQTKPHLLQTPEQRRENVRELLRTVVRTVLGPAVQN